MRARVAAAGSRRCPWRPGPRTARALLLPAVLAACAAPRPPSLARLVDAPASRPLPLADVTARATVGEWPFALGPEAWSLHGPGRPQGDALLLRPLAGRCCSLVRHLELDAEAVDEAVLELAEPWPGRVRLAWSTPGEGFTAEASLVAGAMLEGGSGEPSFVFSLRSHPRWNGPIGALRLTVNGGREGRREIELRHLTLLRFRLDESRLAAAGEGRWRIDLGHERRDALVAQPESPRSWEVDPGGRRLTFGFGTQPLRAGRILFRVWIEEAGEPAPLWEATVGEGALPDDRWHQAALALPAGRTGITLRFDATYEPDLEQVDALAFWSNPELVPPRSSDERPDIALVSVDTLRADRLSLYGYGRPTSPRLDAWAREAMVFERVVTSAPWTLPAHVSLFTGLDGLGHGVNHRTRVPDGLPLLAERLRAAGYQTLAVTGGGYLDPEFGLDRGFERYRYWPEHTTDEELAENVRTALAWLEEPPRRPYFLFFHTYETHYPYRARQPYFGRFAAGVDPEPYDSLAYVTIPPEPEHGFLLSKEWRLGGQPLDERQTEVLGALYDSGVAYADNELAPLLDRLATGEGGRRTVVAITSDHGEALGENGLAGHAYLDETNALVPLVLRLPGGEPAGRIGDQARLVDLAPTLLELAGVGSPAADLDGRSLLPMIRGTDADRRPAWTYAAFSNRGVALRLDNRIKYLWNDSVWPPLAGREALYDLVADPTERTALGRDPRLDRLRGEVTTVLAEAAGALRLHFANGGAEAYSGRLVGGVVQAARLKSPRLPPGALRWQGPRVVAVHVPLASAFDVLIENPTGERFDLALEPGFTATLELGELDTGWRAILDGGRWREAAPGGPAAASEVTVSWNRTFGAPTADPAAADATLREQLKALGYIE